MRNYSARDLTAAALIGALYAAMGYFGNVFGLSFGPIQFRFAEALAVLPFLIPATAPGLAVGCLIANLLSPYGPIDVILGTLATALAAWLTAKMPKWYLAAIPPVAINLLLLPPMWAWSQVGGFGDGFWGALGYNAATFLVGEAVVCWGLGTILLKALPRIPGLGVKPR